ncbi:glycosyltransferase family 32 protein [Paracoccus aestuariivivens]|nr:glycosyltransferase [Paracoccus aestuariivivens]
MTSKNRLAAEIEEAIAIAQAGNMAEAEARLAEIARDPDAASLGHMTILGLPRKLHSARLKLAKLGGDVVAVTGLRATAVPPPELLAELLQPDPQTRAALAKAAGWPVPRIVHQIWIGGPVPPTCAIWRDWAACHGWEYRLWDEQSLAELAITDDPQWQAMIMARDYPGAVDVARYHVLLRDGGLYLDCDWYPVSPERPPEDFIPAIGLSAIAEAGPRLVAGGSVLLANGLIAVPPNHPAIAKLIDVLPQIAARLSGAPAWWQTGPLAFTLAARMGPVTILDPAIWTDRLPQRAPISQVIERVEAAKAKAAFVIEWKSW